MSEPLLTDVEAAAFLRLTLKQTQELFRSGAIRAVKVGRFWRVSQEALNEFVEQGGTVKGETQQEGATEETTK